jgi:hypothetical protein
MFKRYAASLEVSGLYNLKQQSGGRAKHKVWLSFLMVITNGSRNVKFWINIVNINRVMVKHILCVTITYIVPV